MALVPPALVIFDGDGVLVDTDPLGCDGGWRSQALVRLLVPQGGP